jgi:hypothetical protein
MMVSSVEKDDDVDCCCWIGIDDVNEVEIWTVTSIVNVIVSASVIEFVFD